MARRAKVDRKTTETDISLEIELDGTGRYEVDTSIPFFDHMLALFSRHGLFDITLKARGDTDVDFHHTVEDVGLCLGEAMAGALGDKKGIRRYGSATVPMMDALATVVVDVGGRPYLKYNVSPPEPYTRTDGTDFDPRLVEEFLRAFSNTSGTDLHVTLHYGRDVHHSVEAIFKALGRALREAVEIDPRIEGVLSTKGRL